MLTQRCIFWFFSPVSERACSWVKRCSIFRNRIKGTVARESFLMQEETSMLRIRRLPRSEIFGQIGLGLISLRRTKKFFLSTRLILLGRMRIKNILVAFSLCARWAKTLPISANIGPKKSFMLLLALCLFKGGYLQNLPGTIDVNYNLQ